MRTIKLITDSTADLSQNILKEYDIDVVPLHIILGENSYPDDNRLTSKDLFDFADQNQILPKSAAINTYDLIETFKTWIEKDYDIFYMGISSCLSASTTNAMIAAGHFDSERISVVDSKSLSTGIGLQLLETADLINSGASLKDVTELAISRRDKVRASFVVDTLKYLYMGGRCSKLASIVGSRLNLKPKLELIGGEIVPTVKFRGNNFIRKYYDQVMEKAGNVDPKRIFVTHCLSDRADEVKDWLKADFGFENVYITDASAVISTHCGPGTLGILFISR